MPTFWAIDALAVFRTRSLNALDAKQLALCKRARVQPVGPTVHVANLGARVKTFERDRVGPGENQRLRRNPFGFGHDGT